MRKAILALCACALLSGCAVATMLTRGGAFFTLKSHER